MSRDNSEVSLIVRVSFYYALTAVDSLRFFHSEQYREWKTIDKIAFKSISQGMPKDVELLTLLFGIIFNLFSPTKSGDHIYINMACRRTKTRLNVLRFDC